MAMALALVQWYGDSTGAVSVRKVADSTLSGQSMRRGRAVPFSALFLEISPSEAVVIDYVGIFFR